MEMTWEEWRAMKRVLRRNLGSTGWTLLIYYILLNVVVFLWIMGATMARIVENLFTGNFAAIEQAIISASESGWGYFAATAVGFLILLLWKKPCFLKYEVFARGKPMRVGAFFGILCVFLGGQFLSQLALSLLELVLNCFDLTILEGVEALAVDPDNFSMFLYASLLAPVAEEILFRGLIQRRLLPYGRNFAIFVSALMFGLFHGNLIQTPFAFLVGLVLGYVAAEYSVLWAMVLHMINNLVIADSLYRITSFLPVDIANMVIWGVLFVCAVIGIVVLIRNRQKIRDWISLEPIHKTYLSCFFTSAGNIAFMVLMMVLMIGTIFVIVTPL